MKTTTTMLALLTLALAEPAAAQTSPYADEAPRAIKALSQEEVDGLLDGAGLGYARAAELNGVPGPRHVLDMAGQLDLTEPQSALVREIFARMQREARALGTAIVERERELDALFAGGRATAAEVQRRSIELGRLYGELRALHLAAHIETAALLEPQQVARYNELRGYAGADPAAATDPPAGHEAHH